MATAALASPELAWAQAAGSIAQLASPTTASKVDGCSECPTAANGTLTHDITDSVAVQGFVRHKTIILHAGQSFLARKP